MSDAVDRQAQGCNTPRTGQMGVPSTWRKSMMVNAPVTSPPSCVCFCSGKEIIVRLRCMDSEGSGCPKSELGQFNSQPCLWLCKIWEEIFKGRRTKWTLKKHISLNGAF